MVKFVETGFFGDVGEDNRGTIDETSSCNGPILRIFYCGVGRSRGFARIGRLLTWLLCVDKL